MAPFDQVGPLKTWFDVQGSGPSLVLLHPGGAGVDARALQRTLPAFAEKFTTYTPERRAHGRTADVEGPITFEAMAKDAIGFLALDFLENDPVTTFAPIRRKTV